MNAVPILIDESIRLYSRPSTSPTDVIAPQHVTIHGDLERWGAWNRDRHRPGTCASAERHFDGRAGYRSNYYPKLPVALPVNQRNIDIGRAVLRLPMQHRDTVAMFYVDRRSPLAICRIVVVRWPDFPKWMFHCRAMVLNILREQGA